MSAQHRRKILANFHAAYMATFDAKALETNLRQLGALIPETTQVTKTELEGTSIFIKLSDGQGIMLDAYGNTMKGSV